MNQEVHVYLAGPDVFFSDVAAIRERKKAHLAALGLIGHFPFDNELEIEEGDEPQTIGHKIAAANERMMLDCCKDDRIGVILINMTPVRGPFMDVGTAFEVGFMAALSYLRPNVLLIGYSADERSAEARVIEDLFKGQAERKNGRLFAPDGMAVESFGCRESIMVTQAIERTGGKIFKTFEKAALFAQKQSCQTSFAA